MSFQEMDEARKTSLALSGPGGKRGRKRKAGLPGPCGSEAEVSAIEQEKADNADRRTGRWTAEETAYVDQLIANFETGCLPLADGIKLNDFLATMLQCKQSRLTKKMKNAKLSTKAFKRTAGYIVDQNDARNVSGLEEAFFHSIICHQERAEIRFHMQKQWREFFSRFCVLHGQPLDADAWLSSVEEMERRASMAKDAARMARRKLMIGKALSQDIKNTDRGVFIERSANDMNADSVAAACASSLIAAGMPQAATGFSADSEEFLSLLTDKSIFDEKEIDKIGTKQPSKKSIVASPFLDKIMSFLQRSGIAFEHVDAWVPSFIPSPGEGDVGAGNTRTKCRLCYAGSATADVQVTANGRHEPVGNEELFNLLAFGDYSQKFSFDVGCGLPGRVYQTGIPTWEQSVHNAPLEHFERCGGAVQWGIRTVVGIPVPSPKVGRIVVTLYSCHDRQKDQELVGRLCDEFTRLLPSPKWKLVVDLGLQPPPPVAPPAPQASATPNQVGRGAAPGAYNNNGNVKDSRIFEVVSLLGEHMPSDASSPLANYLPGFMTLRLMMLRSSRTPEEEELVRTLLDSYSSYSAAGRSTADIALLLARDCMFLTQQTAVSQSQQIMPRQQQQQQQQFNQ
uniref:Uncharacterized protein n=1 Tax=Proboscia inermis TaxID=420281 RepID=A0A7S0GI16_9STRA